MHIKELVTKNIESELAKVGFDSSYRATASEKYLFKTLKIFDLTPAQANILKQTALSVGADAATHREVITAKIEKSNVILGGSINQLKKIAEKLKYQPFSLGKLSAQIITSLEAKERKTKLVGILNITPDSFSDGGKYIEPQQALKKLQELINDGADIIDIGAESTRPYSEEVSPLEQIERLKPVLEVIKELPVPISIDTRSSEVAEFALQKGAKIINDVSGFDYDSRIADIAAQFNATVIIQHSQGNPQTMQNNPHYIDVIEEIYLSLFKKLEFARTKGIKNIILDVGIGFGKTKEDNFEILNRIEEFYTLNCPLMVGVSRKSLLGIKEDDNNLKDSLTLALNYPLIQKGVDYLRVHNVKLHKQLLNSIR